MPTYVLVESETWNIIRVIEKNSLLMFNLCLDFIYGIKNDYFQVLIGLITTCKLFVN